MTRIDLNADLGEGFGRYRLPHDLELLSLVTSANIACGFHAGDPLVMHETVARATAEGVAVGAHPSYPDLSGFGRREMALTPAEIEQAVIYQVGALEGFCRAAGTRLRYVKPHGALYNRLAQDPAAARAVARAVKVFGDSVVLLGLEGTTMLAEAEALGVPVAREAFIDRAYLPNGQLVPRSAPGAVLDDVPYIVERASRMVTDHFVTAIDGTRRIVRADSLCVHGDGAHALEIVRAVRDRFQRDGITLAPFAP